MTRKLSETTTARRAGLFDELMPLFVAMANEFQDADKKKPDGALNKRKVEIVNRMLKSVFEVLEDETSRRYLDLLDEDNLPQNSDVSLILGQAVAAMKSFNSKYYVHGIGGYA